MKTVKNLKNKHRHDTWVDGLGRIWIYTDKFNCISRGVRSWVYITPGLNRIEGDHPENDFGPYRRIHKRER